MTAKNFSVAVYSKHGYNTFLVEQFETAQEAIKRAKRLVNKYSSSAYIDVVDATCLLSTQRVLFGSEGKAV